MYNNTILDDWINAIDAYIFESDGNTSKLKINVSDKKYFERIIKKIPKFYEGKLVQEKVFSYGEIGLLSAVAYFLVYNMNNLEDYKKFIESFTFNEHIDYNSIIEYFKYNKKDLSTYFDDMVNSRKISLVEIKTSPYFEIIEGIKLTDSIDVLKFTPQTQHILKWAKIYTIGELIANENLENIKYMQIKNLEEIKNKLLHINFNQFNSSEINESIELEKQNLNNKINELILKDPKLALSFITSTTLHCEEYINHNKTYKK